MGLNISLVKYGAPREINCPFCEAEIEHEFNYFDMDCFDPRKFHEFFCEKCEGSFRVKLNISIEMIVEELL